jgi:ParB family chromosome partitioning protein
MIEDVLADLSARGRYDVVICDSVINSVDTVQAESDVLTCLAAFCKPGGRVFFSGRNEVRTQLPKQVTKMVDDRNYIYFPDKDGLTAGFRDGNWFFQKFHTPEQAADLAQRFFAAPLEHLWAPKTSHIWQVATYNNAVPGEQQIVEALAREFDLPWPDGKRVNRSEQAVAAWRAAVALT